VAQIGLLVIAVQGFRGVPDSTGKPTSKGVAVVCLVLALALAGFALFGIDHLIPPR
jgi:hypothetical protein